MKKTTAILGDTGDFSLEVVKTLMKHEFRLLFVTDNEERKQVLSNQLEHQNFTAEIDFLSCEKNGCWEADMIVLLNPDTSSATLVDKIKEVATQKIVMVAYEGNEINDKSDLRELLPWSKVVEVNVNTLTKEVSFCSHDAEAKQEVQQLFERSEYNKK